MADEYYPGPFGEYDEPEPEPSGGYDFFQNSNYYAPGGFDEDPPPEPQGNVAPGLPGSEYNVGGTTHGRPRVSSGGGGTGGGDDSWIGGGTQTGAASSGGIIKRSVSKPGFPELQGYDIPEMDAPEFNAPEWDDNKIKKYTQRNLAAPVRQLREAYQMVANRLPSNPKSRQTLKEALGSYGTGLEQAVASAGRAATAEYGREYGYDFSGKAKSFDAKLKKYQFDYTAQLNKARDNASLANQRSMTEYSQDYAEYLRG